MLTKISKNEKRGYSHERIRKKLQGTSERPRLNIYRSLNHMYVQVIDDLKGKTLVSASTAEGKKERQKDQENHRRYHFPHVGLNSGKDRVTEKLPTGEPDILVGELGFELC